MSEWMNTVVLCSSGTLSQDLGMMEGVPLGWLLQVSPRNPGDSEQISEETCLPVLSILAKISKGEERLMANLLVEWICKPNIHFKKTLITSVLWHRVPVPTPLHWINLWMKKNWINLYSFSDPAYLFHHCILYQPHSFSWPWVYISVCLLSERTPS